MWSFGRVQFDPARRTLSSGDRIVHLPPRESDLLRVLLEAGNKPLSKDQLLAAIWSDCEVEEGNLTQQVSLLRRALASVAGEEAHSYIQTIPKLGYRFMIPAWIESGSPPTFAIPTTAPAPPMSRRAVRIGLLVVALLVWAAIFYWFGEWHARRYP